MRLLHAIFVFCALEMCRAGASYASTDLIALPVLLEEPFNCELTTLREYKTWRCDFLSEDGRERSILLSFFVNYPPSDLVEGLVGSDGEERQAILRDLLLEDEKDRRAHSERTEGYSIAYSRLLLPEELPTGFLVCGEKRDSKPIENGTYVVDRLDLSCWGFQIGPDEIYQVILTVVEFNRHDRDHSPRFVEDAEAVLRGLRMNDRSFEAAVWAYQRDDARLAAEILLDLAEAGDPRAQHQLGWMLRNGIELEHDDRAAFGWYMKAADQGYRESQMVVGWMYANGVGVARDFLEAAFWSHAAAEQGSELARENLAAISLELGWAYAGGSEPYPQDLVWACVWFRLAAENGHEQASPEFCEVLGWLEQKRADLLQSRCVSSGYANCD